MVDDPTLRRDLIAFLRGKAPASEYPEDYTSAHALDTRKLFCRASSCLARLPDGWTLPYCPNCRQSRGRCTTYEWKALRKRVFERDGHRCTYCGATDNLACDHIVPWSLGGADELSNLTTACRGCNSSKHAKRVEDWSPLERFERKEAEEAETGWRIETRRQFCLSHGIEFDDSGLADKEDSFGDELSQKAVAPIDFGKFADIADLLKEWR